MNPDKEEKNCYGLTTQQFQFLENLVIKPLKKEGATVWIFGSRARGDNTPTSDVDVLFDFPNGRKPKPGLLFLIKNDLEESRFPFKLDLVNLQELAKSYRENVIKERQLV